MWVGRVGVFRAECVVPVGVPGVAGVGKVRHLLVGDFDSGGVVEMFHTPALSNPNNDPWSCAECLLMVD